MNKKKLEKIWVAPEFKKKLTYEAKIVRGITVADFTRSLAKNKDDIKEQLREKQSDDKKRKFGFGF